MVDLSIGTPCDPPPPAVVAALSTSDTERGYPPSIGTVELREAASGAGSPAGSASPSPPRQIAACVGTKEFVGTLPQWLRCAVPTATRCSTRRSRIRPTRWGRSSPGAGRCPVPVDADRARPRRDRPEDAARALVPVGEQPGNPTGALDDLAAAAPWGRAHGVPVSPTSATSSSRGTVRGATILEHGLDGVVAVHSLSKRSNLAGVRVGFYAGDPELVHYLQEVRKHVGMMVPGPAQAAGVVALDDDAHVEMQRERYRAGSSDGRALLRDGRGIDVPLPAGGFYLWFEVGDGWAFAERLAREGVPWSALATSTAQQVPTYVRVAVVQPDDRIELVAERLGVS